MSTRIHNVALAATAALAVCFTGAFNEARAASRTFQFHPTTTRTFRTFQPSRNVPGNVRLGPWQTLNSTNSVNSRNAINSTNVRQGSQAVQPRYGAGSSIRLNTMRNCIGVMGNLCASDIRLKRDIVPLVRLENGLDLYRYRYVWSDQAYVGVVAQEVTPIRANAVLRGRDGYLRVDYARLGLRLQTWEEWLAAR